MEIIALIVSVLALIGVFAVLMRQDLHLRKEEILRSSQRKAMKGLALRQKDIAKKIEKLDPVLLQAQLPTNIATRLEALEKGMVPDYEQAKAAAQAVNDFSAGLAGILNFDPFDALNAQREEQQRGEAE